MKYLSKARSIVSNDTAGCELDVSREGIMGKNVANYLAFFARNLQLCSNLFPGNGHFQIKFGVAVKIVE
jgi:hypothetical protein